MNQGLKKSIIFVFILFFVGTIGYSLIEGWSIFDSFYMTIITLSTTGFKELRPLSDHGRFFTTILIIFGISFLFYALGKINIAIFEDQLFKRGKMRKNISKLKDHYIVCGYGRMGEKIAAELSSRKKAFIIIEKNIDNINKIHEHKFLMVTGDATEDDILIAAGINSAKGLVAVLNNDVANVFATLTARGLNDNLKIISRADEESSRQKLIKAGADKVVLPYEIGGFRITQALLKPTVVDYMEELFSLPDLGLEIEEIKIGEKSKLIGKTLANSGIRGKLNIIILSIYRKNGDLIYNPTSEAIICVGDTLVVIGEIGELDTLEEISAS